MISEYTRKSTIKWLYFVGKHDIIKMRGTCGPPGKEIEMIDRNGREIRTGDVVRIENAFTKNCNGLYYVEYSPGDPVWDGCVYVLKKINRNGRLSVAKHTTRFWPLASFAIDKTTRKAAKAWNDEHAEIEVVDDVCRDYILEYFRFKSDFEKDREKCFRRMGEDRMADECKVAARFYLGLAE